MTTDTIIDAEPTPESGPETAQNGDDRKAKAWERGLFMLFFGFIGYFAFWAVVLLAIIQFVVMLVSRETNKDLKEFSTNLAEYLKQIASYLGFATEDRPFPFAPFPKVDAD